MTAPSSEGACIYAQFSICYKPKAIINTKIFAAGASPRNFSFFIIHFSLARKGCPYVSCVNFNAISAFNRDKSITIQRRSKRCLAALNILFSVSRPDTFNNDILYLHNETQLEIFVVIWSIFDRVQKTFSKFLNKLLPKIY